MIRDPIALLALLAAATAAGFWLEHRFEWAKKVGATLLVIAFGALLSNLDLVPSASPVYDAVWGPVTSVAIVWLLFAVDLSDLRRAGPRMLGAFGLAVLGTIAGTLVGVMLLGGFFGDQAWKLGGVLTGTYSGGSLNFIAVGREVGLADSLFAAATAADNIVTSLWMGATLMLPLGLARFYPTAGSLDATQSTKSTSTKSQSTKNTSTNGSASGHESADADEPGRFYDISSHPIDVLVLLAAGLGLTLAADALADAVGLPSVFWLTALALLIAQLPWIRRLRGALALGFLALHLLFVVIGVGSRVSEILSVGLEILYLTLLVVAIHGVILFGGARLFKFDVATAAVASQAAIGGPSSAIALAAARNWPHLALPGMAVGLLGYAVGNYAGLIVAQLLRGWLLA